MKKLHFILICIVLIVLELNLIAQTAKTYIDSRNTEILLPHGIKSFADKVLYYKNGMPAAKGENTNVANAIGEPKYNGNSNDKSNYLSLGCGGEAIFEFTDNALIDIKGPDLFIFEVGLFEAFEVYISPDNAKWYYVGKTKGGVCEIDIKKKANVAKKFYYVKLVDVKTSCLKNGNAGADIDAVAAIGSVPSKRRKNIEPKEMVAAIEKPKDMEIPAVNLEIETTEIIVWDCQQEDKDRVSLYHNKVKIIDNVEVSHKPLKMMVNLVSGENNFVLVAESCGELGGNSGAFKLASKNIDKEAKLNCNKGESKSLNIYR